MAQTNPNTGFIILLLLSALACNWSINPLPPSNRNTPIINQPTATVAPATPSPTPLPPTSAPTLEPTVTPIKVVPPVIPTPEVIFNDLSPHHQAMLPNFATDVDTVAASGASHYYLEIIFDPDSFNDNNGLHLSGTERIRYTNTENETLPEVYFRLYPNLFGGQLEVQTVVVDNQIVTPALEAAGSALRVPLPAALSPGAVADISLIFEADVPTETQQSYNIFSYSNQTAALATFYPVIAVYDDEGWNIEVPVAYGDVTYLDVSLYQVQLTVPEKMAVAASGSLLDSVSNNDGTKTLSLASGPMRDFYLAMRTDYQVSSEIVDGTLVNSYYPPGLEDGGRLALRYAADALQLFNQRFGPYPFAEFDIVATATTAGGVEYPGIVALSESIYNQEGGFFQHAAAHEVAHQWWYALVGNDQVNEPWLDESLTNYSAIIYWEEITGQESAETITEHFLVNPYERAKKLGQDRAVLGPVSDFTEGEYSVFVYGKGALFFDALRQEVGDETYFKIMQTYYAEYKYRIANSDDLFDVIEQVSGKNVDPLIKTWLQVE